MFPLLDVARRTLDIIRERGWCYKFSAHSGSPLNLRSAVSRACTQLCTEDIWHATYALTIKEIRDEIQRGIPEDQQQGVIDWEFGSRSTKKPTRTQAEVEAVLEQVIQRLERDEDTRGAGHGSTGVRAHG